MAAKRGLHLHKFSPGRRTAKTIRWLGYAAAGLAVVIIAAALILPSFLDTPAVEAGIQRRLSQAVGGEVAWKSLSIRLLPSPHGALREVRVEIPGLVDARVERTDVSLSLLPLLHGSAEISSVSVVRPVIRIDVPSSREKQKAEEEPTADPHAAYRAVATQIVEAMRRFAPDTTVQIDAADVEIRVPGLPSIRLDGLSLHARTGHGSLQLEAKTGGNFWKSLALSARIELADLSGKASLEVAELKPQEWLDRYLKRQVGIAVPAANLKAEARAGGGSLECDFTLAAGTVRVSRAGRSLPIAGVGAKGKAVLTREEITVALESVRLGSLLADARARMSLAGRERRPRLAVEIPRLDLVPLRDAALALAGDIAPVRDHAPRVRGGEVAKFRLAAAADTWPELFRPEHLSGGMTLVNGALVAPVLEQEIGALGGEVEIGAGKLALRGAGAQLGASRASEGVLEYSLAGKAAKGSVRFDADLAQALEITRGVIPEKARAGFSVLKSAAGRASGNARMSVEPAGWSVGVDVLSSDASAQVGELPGPLKLAAGSVEITRDAVKIERAAVSFLDARAIASATIGGLRTRLAISGAVSEGTVGEKLLDWVWQIAKAPENVRLKTPIRIAAQRVAWSQKKLGVEATASFDAGPGVGVALDWAPGTLDIRRATIKDARSDATVALRLKSGVLEGRFSGALHGASITSMLKTEKAYSGNLSGDLRFTFDHQHPERISASGKLKGGSIDLAWLLARPVKIDSVDLEADTGGLHIREAAVNWAKQRVTLRGEIRRGADGRPAVDARLESPGVSLDALFPPEEKSAGEKPASPEQPAGGESNPSRVWPLPLTGRISVRSDFLQKGRYKIAPVAAAIVLEENRAHLDLQQAELCGISFPVTLEATPEGFAGTVRLSAQKQQLENAARCLTDHGVLISGEFDLRADLMSKGKLPDLMRNLQGKVCGEARDGKVMKFALLGNILALGNIAASLDDKGPKVDDAGFPYRNLAVAGHFQDGSFVIDESAFNTNLIGLAATGWISVVDYRSKLAVLAAPFGRLDRLARNVPVFGYVMGGSLTSVPVGVSGDIRDPLVVPLGPAAITSELKGIGERLLKLPGRLIPEQRGEPCKTPAQTPSAP